MSFQALVSSAHGSCVYQFRILSPVERYLEFNQTREPVSQVFNCDKSTDAYLLNAVYEVLDLPVIINGLSPSSKLKSAKRESISAK